jgi:hypothetical protein
MSNQRSFTFRNGCQAIASITPRPGRGKYKYHGRAKVVFDCEDPPDHEDEQWWGLYKALSHPLDFADLEFSTFSPKREFDWKTKTQGPLTASIHWRKYNPRPFASSAERINLVMPVITWPEQGQNPTAVTMESPKSHRRAVWKIAQFFRREFHYDFVQYGANGADHDPCCTAYRWGPPDCIFPSSQRWRVHCIGAACFSKTRDPYGFAVGLASPVLPATGIAFLRVVALQGETRRL